MSEFDPLENLTDTSNGTVYTFSGASLGAADAGRHIETQIQARGGTDVEISSVTIGGVTATIVVQDNPGASPVGIVIAAVPTGTTGDIVVTFSGTVARCAIQTYRATGLDSATPYDTGSSTATAPTFNLDVPDGFAMACVVQGDNSLTTSWSGLTEDYDSPLEGMQSSAASDALSAETGRTITATFSGSPTEPVGVFASWAFASSGVTGTGAATTPGSDAAGAGAVPVSGSGAAETPAAEATAAGVVAVSGAAAAESPATVAAGSGQVIVSGVGVIETPGAAASGSGSPAATGTAAAEAPGTTAAAAGSVIVSGAGVVETPPTTAAGSGADTVSGSGAAETPETTASGAGATGSASGAAAATTPGVTARGRESAAVLTSDFVGADPYQLCLGADPYHLYLGDDIAV